MQDRGIIAYGGKEIVFHVVSDRKTMEIAVHPDNSVVVKAPRGVSEDDIQDESVYEFAGLRSRSITFSSSFHAPLVGNMSVARRTSIWDGNIV